MRFTPDALVVHAGDRIVWRNKDLFPHTVTATGKAFHSGSIAADAAWTLVVTAATGEYSYGCDYHPGMKGKIVVR